MAKLCKVEGGLSRVEGGTEHGIYSTSMAQLFGARYRQLASPKRNKFRAPMRPAAKSLRRFNPTQMFVKPVGKDSHVGVHAGPTVIFAFSDDELERCVHFFAAFLKNLRLINRYHFVRVAVDDQSRRQVGGNEVDGRNFLAERLAAFGSGAARAEGGLKFFGRTETDSIIAGLAPIQKISGRIKTGDALDGAAFAVDGIFRVRISFCALRSQGERKMSARAAASNAQVVWVHAKFRGVVPDKSDGAVNVLLDFGNNKFRLRTMHDGKNGVATVEQWFVSAGIDGFVAGEESAADHEQNPEAVGFLRLDNVERQSRAEFASVNHIFVALKIICLSKRAESDERTGQRRGKYFFHLRGLLGFFALILFDPTQIIIEPISELREIIHPIFPAVGFAFLHDEFCFDAGFFGAYQKSFGLLNRNQFIGVAM